MLHRAYCTVYLSTAFVGGILLGRILPIAFLLFLVCLLSVFIGISILFCR